MSFHTLQTTLQPDRGLPASLYLRLRHNSGRETRPDVFSGTGGFSQQLSDGDVLSTDTFFGSFYGSYWMKFAEIRDLAVTVTLKGRAVVRVFEDDGNGAKMLRRTEIGAPVVNGYLLELSSPSLSARGLTRPDSSRLFVEIEAIGACRVEAIDFVTTQAPRRNVSLSIGLCTFNQEAYFEGTLDKIASLTEHSDAIRAVYVVNQGKPFQSSRIRELLTGNKLHEIQQRNLGGCGGFTRSLIEALEAPEPASHHLMMDDDIVLDARMILRARRFLDYATGEIALGAGMLDAMRPTVMYEAGAFLRPNNRTEPYCHNVDLAPSDNLFHFNKPVQTDYNAWWFCILPLESCRTAGLPAPVFIRGDDFEYGQRLAAHGVPTITLPGIAVWHEPFYAKAAGWQDYYDLRNRLIFGATYGSKVRQLSLVYVLGMISSAMLTHNYTRGDLQMRAVNDFLDGPETLFGRDPEDIHNQVMAIARTDPPKKLDNDIWRIEPISDDLRAPPPPRMASLIRTQAWALLRTGLGRRNIDSPKVLMDRDAHVRNTTGRAYVLTNGPRSFHLLFVPQRARLWRQAFAMMRLALRYRRNCSAAGRAWADGIAAYHQLDWWAPVLCDRDDGDVAPDADVEPDKTSESAPAIAKTGT